MLISIYISGIKLSLPSTLKSTAQYLPKSQPPMQLPSSSQKTKETVIVGLCFMQRKLKAKRNKQVYERVKCKQITLVQLWPYFDRHWSTWPVVDVLFQSHTADFPYIMVYEYVQEHKPFLVNDIENEQLLWDRTVTYKMLTEINVPVPRYFPLYLHENHVDRLEKECYGRIFGPDGELVPYEEYKKNTNQSPGLFRQLYNGERQKFFTNSFTQTPHSLSITSPTQSLSIPKPFIQKPSDSNDHKVSLYYQQSLGGGRRFLYRQDHGHTSSAESHYQNNQNQIRKDQNYIYQQFIGANVFDIKVYTVGEFIFAESRRSPMVDVEKDCKNSELRHEVELTAQERDYCKRIVQKFNFPICGLDILRSDANSYVCDINGWAFAKGGGLNEHVSIYWNLLAQMLKNIIFQKFFPEKAQKLTYQSLKDYKNKSLTKCQITQIPFKSQELRSVIQILSAKVVNSQKNMAKMGQQIRKKSYDNLDCLGLYSTFENSLKVQCLCSELDPILIGYLLKGYLGIKGEISPPLISMIKMNEKNKNDRKQFSSLQGIEKIIQIVEGSQIEANQVKQPKLKTFIYVGSDEFLEQIKQLIDNYQKLPAQIQYENSPPKQVSRIQFKIYSKYSNFEESTQLKQTQNQKRVETNLFQHVESQRNESKDRVRSVCMDQAQFFRLVNK